MALLVPAGAASAQTDAAASAGDGGPAAGPLLAGAAVLLLAAVLIGYGVPALRGRRASRHDEPAVAAPSGGHPEPSSAQPRPPSRPSIGPGAGTEPRTIRFTQTGASTPVSGEPPERHPPAAVTAPSAGSEPPRDGSDGTRPIVWTGGQAGHAPARPSGMPHPGRELALGYTTFPERKRAVSPESRYQARRIRAACEARDMVLHQLVGDVQSYAGPDLDRPGLNHALELLGAGEVTCLVVAGLDRLSRSAANLGTVIEWLDEMGARLIVIDIDLDTSTEEGRLAARALARVGALERGSGAGGEPGSQQGRPERPPRGGRRAAVSDRPLLQRRIATMRASGMTLQAIADTLNKEGVPTLRGGAKWRPSSVQAATGYKRPGRDASEAAQADREDHV